MKISTSTKAAKWALLLLGVLSFMISGGTDNLVFAMVHGVLGAVAFSVVMHIKYREGFYAALDGKEDK